MHGYTQALTGPKWQDREAQDFIKKLNNTIHAYYSRIRLSEDMSEAEFGSSGFGGAAQIRMIKTGMEATELGYRTLLSRGPLHKPNGSKWSF